MDEQKTLTLDFIKSLMEPAYTLIWTDYNDNLDNHCGLIQKCLDSKSREHLWEKADEWYSVSIRFTTYFLEVFENIWDKIWRN